MGSIIVLNIRLIAVGTLKEKYFADAVAEHAKRLSKYCKFEIVEIKESTVKKETDAIKEKIKGYSILCDIKGELITSESLADKINKLTQINSAITFIIGGSDGVGDISVNEKISLGRITLPHQLFRVVLAEQIYRAFTIIKGEKYHK